MRTGFRHPAGSARRRAGCCAVPAVVVVAYLLSVQAARLLGNTHATAIWLPSGAALAAVVLGGRRRIGLAIALAALAANLTNHGLLTALATAGGTTAQALLGATLIARVRGFRRSLDRIRDVVALAVLAGALSTTVGATVGVLARLQGGPSDPSWGWRPMWRAWWIGGMCGVVLLASPVLVIATRLAERRAAAAGEGVRRSRRDAFRAGPEPLIAALALAALGLAVFRGDASVAYLLLPPLVSSRSASVSSARRWPAWRSPSRRSG
jgi:integral membrane sensor domain MASE1